MKLHIATCNKCRTIDHKYLVKTLLEKYPDATFEVRCQSYCGPGSIEPFVAINEVFISAPTMELLIEEVDKYIEVNYVK